MISFSARRTRFGLHRWFCAAAVLATWFGQPAAAAETYKKGDEVEVLHLGKWTPGKVLSSTPGPRGELLIEYKFFKAQQGKFLPADIRFAYESGALARGRTWTSASGSFKVTAAIIHYDLETVTLRKPDMTEITVPVDKLSESDLTFLKKLEKFIGPIAPKAGAVEEFPERELYSSQTWRPVGRAALDPDPVWESDHIKQGGIVVPVVDFFDQLAGVLPVGGAEPGLLAVVENGTPGARKPGRLLWTSLDKQKILGQQALPPDEIVMDYHAGSSRLLTCSPTIEAGGKVTSLTLSLWEVLPTDKQPKLVVRWLAEPNRTLYTVDRPWARLINANTVLLHRKKHEYVAWDVSARELRYRVWQESFFGAPVTVTGSGRYVIVPEDKGIRILEASTGELVSTLPVKDRAAGAAVSADGTRLAVLGQTELTVWNLTSADARPEVYPAEAFGTPFDAQIAWAGPDQLVRFNGMFSMLMYSLRARMVLWRYEFDSDAINSTFGRRVRDVIDNHLVYAASVGKQARTEVLAVGAVSLPGPRVNETTADATREKYFALKPSSEVKLIVEAGEHQAQVEAALIKQVQANGWVLRPESNIALVAEMKIADATTTNYVNFRTGETTSVTVAPHVSTLKVKIGDVVAWQSGTQGGAAPVLHLREGESAQAEAEKFNQPNVKFFEKVDLPDSLLDPAVRAGLGVTKVTNRGLQPAAADPPVN